jgi:hypothetical protein
MDSPSSLVLEEIQDGHGIGFAAVARKFRESGSLKLTASTVSRWADRGCRGASGERIRLEHIRLGNRFVTSWAAVSRFITAMSVVPEPGPTPRTPFQRNRAVERANAELVTRGC